MAEATNPSQNQPAAGTPGPQQKKQNIFVRAILWLLRAIWGSIAAFVSTAGIPWAIVFAIFFFTYNMWDIPSAFTVLHAWMTADKFDPAAFHYWTLLAAGLAIYVVLFRFAFRGEAGWVFLILSIVMGLGTATMIQQDVISMSNQQVFVTIIQGIVAAVFAFSVRWPAIRRAFSGVMGTSDPDTGSNE